MIKDNYTWSTDVYDKLSNVLDILRGTVKKTREHVQNQNLLKASPARNNKEI